MTQTLKNIEILLVDDGSPDQCGKICDEYAEKDKRIRVLHKKNGGLSSARNYGCKAAQGKPIVKEALKTKNTVGIGKQRKIVLFFIKHHMFLALDMMGKMRKWQKRNLYIG